MGETRAGLERLMVHTSASRERWVKQTVEIWRQSTETGKADGCQTQGRGGTVGRKKLFRGSWNVALSLAKPKSLPQQDAKTA